MTAYQVIYWSSIIKPGERNNSNLSDGAIFRHEADAEAFALAMAHKGGKILRVQEIENASHWFESLEEFGRASTMTADELHAIGQRGKAPLHLKPRTSYRNGLGKRVDIAGLAKRDFEGKPCWWSIQGDHYTEGGLFVGSRRVPRDGSHNGEQDLESYVLTPYLRNLVSEDDSEQARKWWENVTL